MLNVFFTVDVEIWCGSWDSLEDRFPKAFNRYIYGRTSRGDYGLPYQLDILKDHGLKGVFFVEPLFSTRFGNGPLEEIVGLINESGHDTELHLHTEWVDESKKPLLEDVSRKRQHLRYFSLTEQTILIEAGIRFIQQAGAEAISAFRAGSFAFNKDTLKGLAANGIRFDSSYNASLFGLDSGVMPGVVAVEPFEHNGVFEYPLTVFNDGSGKLRHVQLTSCSFREMEGLLWLALEEGRKSFVLLSHNFELLNQAGNRPDDVVVRRLHKLCSFLDKNRDCFKTSGFNGLSPQIIMEQPAPLTSPTWKTCARIVEQIYRRRYG